MEKKKIYTGLLFSSRKMLRSLTPNYTAGAQKEFWIQMKNRQKDTAMKLKLRSVFCNGFNEAGWVGWNCGFLFYIVTQYKMEEKFVTKGNIYS